MYILLCFYFPNQGKRFSWLASDTSYNENANYNEKIVHPKADVNGWSLSLL